MEEKRGQGEEGRRGESDHAEESGSESGGCRSAGRVEKEEGCRPGISDSGETGKSGEQPMGEGTARGRGKRKKRSDVALLLEG